MSDVKNYAIPLNGISATDLCAVKTLFEANSTLFDSAILSVYGGDIRYAVMEGSFAITRLTERKIHYSSQVNYFAPCHDQNEIFETKGSAEYKVVGTELILSLDETLWNVE